MTPIFRFFILFLLSTNSWSATSCKDLLEIVNLPQNKQFHSRNLEWAQVGDNVVLPLIGAVPVAKIQDEIIQGAQKKIVIGIASLHREESVLALIEKIKAGVEVNIVVSDITKQLRSLDTKDKMLSAYNRLIEAGANIVEYPYALISQHSHELKPEYHRKIIIADDEIAYVGSANMSAHLGNFEAGVVVSGNIVSAINQVIVNDREAITKRNKTTKNSNDGSIEIISSPEQRPRFRNPILEEIGKAERSITMAQYYLEDRAIIDALVQKKKKDPKVLMRIVLGEKNNANTILGREISVPANLAALNRLKEAGIETLYGELGDLDRVHAKLSVFDSITVLLGSTNLSSRSLNGSLETSLLIRSPALASSFEEGINHVYDSSLNRQTPVTKGRALVYGAAFWIHDLLRGSKRMFGSPPKESDSLPSKPPFGF